MMRWTVALMTLAAVGAQAAVNKGTTGTDLTAGTSWVGGTAPGTGDVATWASGTALGGALTIGSAQSWQGIDIKGATAAITTSGAGTLTLGSSGINIASGGVNLTLGNSRTFGGTSYVAIGSGRTLTLSANTTTFGAGTTTTFSGGGTAEFGGTSHTITGSGAIIVDGVTFFNNLQTGGTSAGFSGAVTLKSGVYKMSTTLELLGTGTFTINGGSIGSGNANARSISNALTIGGNFGIGDPTGTLGLGTGAITFSNTGTVDLGGATRTITTAAATTIAGAITNGNLIKAGASTLTLSGSLSAGSSLTMAGGAFSYTGAAAQTVNGLTINAGASVVTNGNTGTTNKLNMGAITHNVGGVVNFSTATAANNVITTSNANTNGILGPWATVGSDWAANDGSGNIIAYTGYTDVQRLTPGTIADGAASNVRIIEGSGSAGNIALGATDTTINALLQSASGGTSAATIDAASKTLRTGSLLVVSTAGALTIGTAAGSGTLTAASAGGELILRNNTAGTGSTLTINSIIANNTSASSLTITTSGNGSGIINLTGNNTYSGGTTLAGAGWLELSHNNALGNGGVTFNNSDTFRVTSNGNARSLANAIAINGEGTVRIGTTTSGYTGAFTFSGAVSLGGGNHPIDAAQDITFSNTISDGGATPGGIVKQGAYTLTLSGANTYTGGTTISSGALKLSNQNALQNSTLNYSAGTLVFDSSVSGKAFTIGGLSGASNIALQNNAGTPAAIALTVGGNNATTTYSGVFSAGGSLTKAGSGTLTLSNANTYTGVTTVKNGILALTSGSDRLAATGSVVLGDASTSGKLVLGNSSAAISQTLAGLTITGSGGSVVGGNASNSTLTLNIASGNSFGGVLGGMGEHENNLALTKAGLGILLLSGTNTYTGGTTVSAGTLEIATSGALSGTSSVVVAGGATLKNDGTVSGSLIVDVGGVLSGAGTVTGPTTILGTHAPGDSPGTQSFHAGLTYNDGAVLEWEFSGDALTLRGTDYDGIDIISGDLTIGNPVAFKIINYGTLSGGVDVDYTAADWDVNRTFNVISLTGGGSVLGTLFTLDDTTSAPGSQGAWSLVSNSGGVDLKWTAIPEPATFSLLGAATLVALLRRRTHKAE